MRVSVRLLLSRGTAVAAHCPRNGRGPAADFARWGDSSLRQRRSAAEEERDCGRRTVWLKRIADSRRWTAQRSARLPARAARRRTGRARLMIGPARKRAKPAARAAWRAIADARKATSRAA